MKSYFSLLLLSISVFASCTSSPPTRQTPVLPPIVREGVHINYESCGQGDTALLFVHGWGINQSYWQPQKEAFCGSYRIISLDLPGFGESGKNRTDWSLEGYAADVLALISQLDLKHVILIGHSMGGNIILETALNTDRVIALVGIDNFKEIGMDYTTEIQAEADAFLELLGTNYQESSAAFAEAMLFHPSTDANIRRRVISDIQHADSAIAIASLAALFQYAPQEAERLRELTLPLFLLNSDATPTSHVGLRETGIYFQVFSIPATGHYPMLEKPAIFNQQLKSVLTALSNLL